MNVIITSPCETLTVASKDQRPIKCGFCADEIGDHLVRVEGHIYCSQGCALGDGQWEWTTQTGSADQ